MPDPLTRFRTGNPTFDEGRVFAQYLNEAAEGFFRLMLGKRFIDIIAMAYTQPGHDLSYQNVIFAERSKVIVGMISGYTAEQHHQSSDELTYIQQKLRYKVGENMPVCKNNHM